MTDKVKGQIEHIAEELKKLCKEDDLQMFLTMTDDDETSFAYYMDNEKQDAMLTSVDIGIYGLMKRIFVSVDEEIINAFTDTLNKTLKLEHKLHKEFEPKGGVLN